MSEQQTQQADDPSGPGWRWVMQGEALRHGDVQKIDGEWHPTIEAGYTCPRNHSYRRRIEPQQPSDSEPEIDHRQCVQALQQIAQLADTGSEAHKKRFCRNGAGDGIANGWRVAEAMREVANNVVGGLSLPQPSDSEPETMEQLRRRLAECEVLLAEAGGSGEQVNAELQQLREQVATLTQERDEHARKLGFARECAEMSRRQVADEAGKVERLEEQVQTLTRERDRYRNQLSGAIEHGGAPEAQAQLVDRLQKWLRPVLELVAEHPEDASPLAVAVLGYLPGIASRLIEDDAEGQVP